MPQATASSAFVNTVLGPVPAHELGVVAVHEALLSVLPGAEYAFDISFDRAQIFALLADQLRDFRSCGGGAIVDATGMFHGRSLAMYEALSRATDVHIVASTGMGPEELLGGYFLTPQTNPPTPWPADKFADLFAKEVTEGMVVPRLERRQAAGVVVTAAAAEGMTPTEESLFRAAARTAIATGIPASIRFGKDALHDLDIVLDEGVSADRVVVSGLDRADAVAAGAALAIARRGAYVALDHVGTNDDDTFVTDQRRAALVIDLVAAGLGDRVLLSSSATGVAKGHPANLVPYSFVLSSFVPYLRSHGVAEAAISQILIDNPRELLTVRATDRG